MLFNSYNSRVITKTYHGNVQIYRHMKHSKSNVSFFAVITLPSRSLAE